MTGELKKIKKLYGENFAKKCRDLFPTLLEDEGVLLSLLTSLFVPTKSLFEDMEKQDGWGIFQDYINSYAKSKNEEPVVVDETPETLFENVGYTLYKCETFDDVLNFKQYYAPGEELCTFRDKNRINTHHIYFAVKNDVDDVKRGCPPCREDSYGRSVVCLQFSKNNNYLSIKTRYNHTVPSPDAMFGNNLDLLVPGLTKSFEKYESLKYINKNDGFCFDNYVVDKNGKAYKFTHEIDNVYYCENNTIITDGEVTQYDKSRYELIEYFLLDKSAKTLKSLLYDYDIEDSFINEFTDIKKIDIEKKEKNRRDIIVTKNNGQQIVVTVDKSNNIVGYVNNHVKVINDNFLYYCSNIENIQVDELMYVGDSCLNCALKLNKFNASKLLSIGDDFLQYNTDLEEIYLPSICSIGDFFLYNNKRLKSLSLPCLKNLGYGALYYNEILDYLNLPEVVNIGANGFSSNNKLNEIYFPNVEIIDDYFMLWNNSVTKIYMPKVKIIGDSFFSGNYVIEQLIIPALKKGGKFFCADRSSLEYVDGNRKVLEKLGFSNKLLNEMEFKNKLQVNGKLNIFDKIKRFINTLEKE